ncbi:hypothetical protein K1719_039511 [Acacia pycnantha]|nr:hypothetical protein K1719_039511 [Acacia pycnantha]
MFFREICDFELNVEKLRHLEASMLITLCKLEMVFSCSLDLRSKGRRFLRTLKKKIKNPRYVNGSIAEAFLVEEATKFASYYYPPEMISRWRGVPHNDDGNDTSDQISIFNFLGRIVGKHWRSTLEGSDKKVAECYFSNWVQSANRLISDSEVEQFRNSEFLDGCDPTSWKIEKLPMMLYGVYLMELQQLLPDAKNM